MKVELYSKTGCTYCVQAKKLLEDRGVEYDYIDVSAGSIEDQTLAREKLIDRVVEATGDAPRTMPQIFADGEYVGGFKQLAERLG